MAKILGNDIVSSAEFKQFLDSHHSALDSLQDADVSIRRDLEVLTERFAQLKRNIIAGGIVLAAINLLTLVLVFSK